MKTSTTCIIASPVAVRIRHLILHNVIFDDQYKNIDLYLKTNRIHIDPLFPNKTKLKVSHVKPRFIEHSDSIIMPEIVIHPCLPIALRIESKTEDENMFVFQDKLKHSALRFFMDPEMSQESGMACDAKIEIL